MELTRKRVPERRGSPEPLQSPQMAKVFQVRALPFSTTLLNSIETTGNYAKPYVPTTHALSPCMHSHNTHTHHLVCPHSLDIFYTHSYCSTAWVIIYTDPFSALENNASAMSQSNLISPSKGIGDNSQWGRLEQGPSRVQGKKGNRTFSIQPS